MHFAERLVEAVRRVGNPVLVGIDPRVESLPEGLKEPPAADRAEVAGRLLTFARGVVDVVAPLVAAVKLQAAYFEMYGPEGMGALHEAARYARERGLLVIMDGKRNDIGSTAEAYARAYLGTVPIGERSESAWDVDALTVNPYLGSEGVQPFIRQAAEHGNGVFVLVRTSNQSAWEFQDRVSGGRPLYRHVAERVAQWAEPQRGPSGYSLVGAVVGATYPAELAELRENMPGVWFLVPGYGAQGGTAGDVAAAFDAQGLGAVVNSSRGITFAYRRPDLSERFPNDWQGAVAHAAREMIDDLAAHTAAGKLRAEQAR